VPGYEASTWNGIVVERPNKEINVVLTDAKNKSRLAAMGSVTLAGSFAYFGKLIAEETEKWGKVVKFSGAKPE